MKQSPNPRKINQKYPIQLLVIYNKKIKLENPRQLILLIIFSIINYFYTTLTTYIIKYCNMTGKSFLIFCLLVTVAFSQFNLTGFLLNSKTKTPPPQPQPPTSSSTTSSSTTTTPKSTSSPPLNSEGDTGAFAPSDSYVPCGSRDSCG